MNNGHNGNGKSGTGVVVQVSGESGLSRFPMGTPLRRLHYYDGKFLRAADLSLEQLYVQSLVHLSNQAGGNGVVWGLDARVVEAQDLLAVGAGMAIDPLGQVLLNPGPEIQVAIEELIAASRAVVERPGAAGDRGSGSFADCEVITAKPAPPTTTEGPDLYLITIGHAEAKCGTEDVYGKLCEEACITSTDRSFEVEGLVLRAIPLTLSPFPTFSIPATPAWLRSQVASAFFGVEDRLIGSLIGGPGLRSGTWCMGSRLVSPYGAPDDVALGVLGRSGKTTLFFDAWTARRERMSPPSRRYWAGRMAMRPWEAYLAQILQFQCQLGKLLATDLLPTFGTPPSRVVKTARDAVDVVGRFRAGYEAWLGNRGIRLEEPIFTDAAAPRPAAPRPATAPPPVPPPPAVVPGMVLPPELLALLESLNATLSGLGDVLEPSERRFLIQGGIVELPPAGYLPVSPGSSLTVNQQVRRMLGEGVDLRFCVVRPDFVPHAVEEAQHMERISLLAGIDNPAHKPAVDILVPDGEIVRFQAGVDNMFRAQASLVMGIIRLSVQGVGRAEVLPTGGAAFHVAGARREAKIFVEPDRKLATVVSVHGVEGAAAAAAPPAPAAAAPAPAAGGEVAGAAETIRRTSRLRSLFMATSRSESSEPTPLEISVPRTREVTAAWLTMRTERNPFTLPVNGETLVTAKVILVLDRDVLQKVPQPVGEASLRGDFRVTRTFSTGEGTRVEGVLTGVITTGEDLPRTGDDNCDSGSVRLRLALVGGPAAGSFAIELFASKTEKKKIEEDRTIEVGKAIDVLAARGSVSWAGDPLAVRVAAAGEPDAFGDNPPRLKGMLRRDQAVLSDSDEAHRLALLGIDRIAAALDSDAFRKNAVDTLFPAPIAEIRELVVKAREDWVLFHRRRDKRCSPVIERPIPAPAARFRVLLVPFDPDLRVEELARRLEASPEDLDVQEIMVVDYASHRATPGNDFAVIRAAWQKASPGDELLLGAIAGPSTEDLDVEADRLRLFEQIVGYRPDDPDTTNLPPLQPVPALLTPGVDGYLIFYAAPAVTCQAIYKIAYHDQELESRWKVALSEGPDNLEIPLRMAEFVGDAHFRKDGVDPLDDGGWSRSDQIARAIVFHPSSSDGPREKARAVNLFKRLGGVAKPLELRLLPARLPQLPSKCSVHTFVFSPVQLTISMAVYEFVGNERVASTVPNAKLSELVKLKLVKPRGEVHFDGETVTAGRAADLKKLEAAWTRGKIGHAVLFGEKVLDLHRQRAMAIATDLDTKLKNNQVVVRTGESVKQLTDCEVVVVLIPSELPPAPVG